MITTAQAQRIEVAPATERTKRSGASEAGGEPREHGRWIVTCRDTPAGRAATHAVFVGKNARARAIDWALRLADARRPHGPVMVVVLSPPDQRPGRLAS